MALSSPLPTAAVADACVRLGLGVRLAPAGTAPVLAAAQHDAPIHGPALPVRHAGSVDAFLEAMLEAPAGGILVVDNAGRRDEGCVGDLTAWAARGSGLVGMVVWGCHRDSADLRRMAFPTWSLGACPSGPLAPRPRDPDTFVRAQLGETVVTREDWVYADADGVVVVAAAQREHVEAVARTIYATERAQADHAAAGTSIVRQLDVAGFVAARNAEPSLTFREHLRRCGGAIET